LFSIGEPCSREKEAYRKAFTTLKKRWLLYGRTLKSIYTVVYGCDWDLIENIIIHCWEEPGGRCWVSYASAAEVKEAAMSAKNGILT